MCDYISFKTGDWRLAVSMVRSTRTRFRRSPLLLRIGSASLRISAAGTERCILAGDHGLVLATEHWCEAPQAHCRSNPKSPVQHHRPERGILLREKVKAVTTGAQPRGGQLVLSRLAVQQRNQGLSRGRRLNRGAGHDLPRADGLPVEALVSVTVRVERGAVE